MIVRCVEGSVWGADRCVVDSASMDERCKTSINQPEINYYELLSSGGSILPILPRYLDDLFLIQTPPIFTDLALTGIGKASLHKFLC